MAILCSCYVLFSWAWRTVQTVCKPGSVLAAPERGDGWPFIWGVRCRTPRRDLPGRRCGNPPAGLRPRAAPIRSCSRWGLPCHQRYRRRGALLPHPFTLAVSEDMAVCSLWHFPWGRPRRPLAGTVFPWSPDFPPPDGFPHCRKAAIRPSGPPANSVQMGFRSTVNGRDRGDHRSGPQIRLAAYGVRHETSLERGDDIG